MVDYNNYKELQKMLSEYIDTREDVNIKRPDRIDVSPNLKPSELQLKQIKDIQEIAKSGEE